MEAKKIDLLSSPPLKWKCESSIDFLSFHKNFCPLLLPCYFYTIFKLYNVLASFFFQLLKQFII